MRRKDWMLEMARPEQENDNVAGDGHAA